MDRARKLDALIDGAEELLTNLSDVRNPEIQHLRDRVDHAIEETRRVIAETEDDVSIKLRDIAETVDDYVHDYPWLALATCALIAGTLGFIAGATRIRKQPVGD